MTSQIRSIGFFAAFVSVFAGAGILYAQTFPSSSPYTQCVAPHIRSYEDQVFALQQTYEQQVLQLMRQRADARIVAWTIPERSARSRAIRDAERVYRDGVRVLNRLYRDQHKVLLRQFKDAEDVCDDQFDNDVEDGGGFSSSSFSSRPVCGNRMCESGEGLYCPPCDAFPCTQSCAVGTCPQDCPGFSSSRSSSRSSSSVFISCFGNDPCVPQQNCFNAGGTIASPGACGNQSQVNAGYACCRLFSSSRSSSSSWIFSSNNGRSQTQQIESCGCQTVCDPSGSPCMAVCQAEC